MTHKTHSSWKSFRPKRGVPAVAPEDLQRRQAEGQARPEPGLTPPMTYDEHFDAKVKALREQQEAEDAPENDQTPEQDAPEQEEARNE